MRLIGHIEDESSAQRFGDYLYGEGIENQVEKDKTGRWEIWVLDEDEVDDARAMLDRYRDQPDDPRYARGVKSAAARRKLEEKAEAKRRSRLIDGRTFFSRPPVPFGMVTIGLILISVAVAFATRLGTNGMLTQKLQVTEYSRDGNAVSLRSRLPEICGGQVWRIFTPMFVHFGIIHVLFNMLWLRDLGSMIEARKGSWLLLLLVLTVAGISNMAQYLWNGPYFGGMSGVVFGLFGYVWMQGKFNPNAQLQLQQQIVTLMIVWFFVCLTGLLGPIANMAHGAGAVVGIAWGFLAAKLRPEN